MKLLPSLTRLHTERQFSKTTDIRLQKADLSFFFLELLQYVSILNPFRAKPTKSPNKLKEFGKSQQIECVWSFCRFDTLKLNLFQANVPFLCSPKMSQNLCFADVFNPFHATGIFRYTLKTSEHLWFSVFRGYRKRPVAWNGLSGKSGILA